jgi:hypothetical protein
MTDFLGSSSTQGDWAPDPTWTAALSTYGILTNAPRGVLVPFAEGVGVSTGREPVSLAPQNALTGHVSPGFDSQWFEKMIQFPANQALGFVLSDQEFTIELFSNYRFLGHVLTSLTLAGPGSATVTPPSSLPIDLWPMESLIFTIDVPSAGESTIDESLTLGITDVPDVVFLVTGTRLVIFGIDIDWSAGFQEGVAYHTVVMTAYDGTEQRSQLLTQPRYSAAYTPMTLTPRETSWLNLLLFSRKSAQFGVPWWPDASTLQSDVSASSTTIPVDTTDRAFVAGGLVMLWKNQFTYEALTIDTVASDHVTLTSQTTDTWSALTTRVVPMRRGRLLSPQPVTRPTGAVATANVQFSCEVVP